MIEKLIGTIAEKGADIVLTFTPKDGGMVLVTLEKATKSGPRRMEVEMRRVDIEPEAAKLGLARPTPQTPVATDRVTG